MTLVSLIMPVWRPRPDWLHGAIRSALDEHACEIELIVVDDGNEQPVSELISSFDDPRMHSLRVEHCGPYAARNAGIAAARGDFIRFVDADDIVERGSSGRLFELTRAAGGETIAYGWTMICDEQLNTQKLVSERIEGDVAEISLLGGFDVYHTSMLYPRSVVERIGPWEEIGFRVSGDSDYVQRALEQAPVRGLGEIVTRYRRHPTSVSKTARVADAVRSGMLILDRYFERHPERRGSALERRAYTKLHLLRARSHFGLGEIAPSLRQLALAARRDPLAVTSAGARLAARRLTRLTGRLKHRSA